MDLLEFAASQKPKKQHADEFALTNEDVSALLAASDGVEMRCNNSGDDTEPETRAAGSQDTQPYTPALLACVAQQQQQQQAPLAQPQQDHPLQPAIGLPQLQQDQQQRQGPQAPPQDQAGQQPPSKAPEPLRSVYNATVKPRVLPGWMLDPAEAVRLREAEAKKMMETKNSFLDAAEAFFLSEKPDDELAAVREFTQSVFPFQEELPRGRVICFDLETTGFSREDCIIEVGGVEVIDGVRTGAIFQSYALPTAPVNPMAFEVPGRHSVAFLTKSAGAQT
eukprot:TRINITY_DN5417_c0_g1_i1.p1 TRINITY_DN5417_c0_g1~~TRINITY_DN5417_c0_g1_i1.p1  ORF type:complete len:295 (+),score=70.16 TRINITY_DN5417_c0_g1_i1:51-887(+)